MCLLVRFVLEAGGMAGGVHDFSSPSLGGIVSLPMSSS